MTDPYGERASVMYLKPREAYFIRGPLVVVTVLGSCLTVTMFHKRLGLSAICHALLPRCDNNGGCRTDCREKFKYVDCSIREMAGRLETNGAKRGELEVKIFGGADMFTVREGRADYTVGRKNFLTAVEALARERLVVAASDVGGTQGRKIYFHSDTGRVLLKRLRNTEGIKIFLAERIAQAKDWHGC